jgi:hypothetical protein
MTRCDILLRLAITLLSVALPASLKAQLSYLTNSDGSLLITGYSGTGGAVVIPSSINNLPVTGIGNSVFKQKFNITSVTIPNSILTIGNNAFDSCLSLTQITIPDSVTNIGTRAFQTCINVTNVIIGNGVISIGDSAFWSQSALKSLVLGTNLTSIGGHAFESCGLTSVRVPDQCQGA